MALKWSTWATIIYFAFYFILLLTLAIYIHATEHYNSKYEYALAFWKKKGIYAQILVHLYDTATDFGVLIQWYQLAYDQNDYESIDMVALFWTAMAFIIAYRYCNTPQKRITARLKDYVNPVCKRASSHHDGLTFTYQVKTDTEESQLYNAETEVYDTVKKKVKRHFIIVKTR